MSQENREKPVKIEVFSDFLGNCSNDFNKKLHEDRGGRYGAARENRTSKSYRFAGKSRTTGENIGFSGFSLKLQ